LSLFVRISEREFGRKSGFPNILPISEAFFIDDSKRY